MLVLIHGSIPGWLNMAAYLLSKGVCIQLLKVRKSRRGIFNYMY